MSTELSLLERHQNVTSQLQELGLSIHDAEVYLTVLESGEVSAGPILDRLPLHREQVYRALKRLVDAELLVSYTKRKRSYYAAANPAVLVRKQEAKMALARSLEPYLQQLQQNRPQIIQVIEGADALNRLLDDILASLPKASEYLVLGGVGELFYQKIGQDLPGYSRQFKKKDIGMRIIAFQGQSYLAEQELLNSQVKYLPQPMGGPTATVIYGNKVGIEIFDPNNLAVIIIENQFLADSYRQTFEGIWQLSA